jgi:hypothetical protein
MKFFVPSITGVTIGLNWMLRIHQVPVLLQKLIARYPSNFDVLTPSVTLSGTSELFPRLAVQ